MQAGDKIGKSSWELLLAIKDTVSANVLTAQKTGLLKVDPTALPQLLTLLNASMEEGYHKGYRVFMKTVTAAIEQSTSSKPAKKK